MIEPKEIEIDGKVFIIHKFDAYSGREIISQYVVSGVPKLGDYAKNEEISLKMMAFVSVPMPSGVPLKLSNKVLVNNHVTDFEMLLKIEMALMEYNCSFFQNGRISGFLDSISEKLPAWILKISKALSEQSSRTEKPHSEN
jgi:hypothetical protein